MGMSPKLLRPRQTGFTPRNIANLTSWFDAGDVSTFTFNGSNVSEWRSKVGGWAAAQTTAANQPTRITDFLTSRAAVRFTAVTQTLLSTATWNDLGNNSAQTITEFYVVQWPTGSNQAFVQENNASTGHKVFAYYNNTTAFYDAGPESTARVSGAVGSAVVTGVIITAQRNGANVSLTYGTTSIASRANASGNLYASLSAGVLFAGAAGGNSSLAEVLTYSRALSTSEIQSVRSYLQKRYGL